MLLTVKCMKILGNSIRELLPHQKKLLYRTCTLLITLYMDFYYSTLIKPLYHVHSENLEKYNKEWLFES